MKKIFPPTLKTFLFYSVGSKNVYSFIHVILRRFYFVADFRTSEKLPYILI